MIRIVEVGPRDGLQNEPQIVPTVKKIAFVDALSVSGVSEVEVTSFVAPRWIPQLADAADVLAKINRNPDVIYSALIPNERGYERAIALDAPPDRIAVFVAASETFNRKNINTDADGAFARFRPLVSRAEATGISVRGYISTVFSCPYEGIVPARRTLEIAQRLLDLGCIHVALGDTIGQATPDEVRALLDLLLPRIDPAKIAMHFHDTYGRAADNVRASLDMGIHNFDGSVGGLGGCPFAGPGAPGNIATETVVEIARDAGEEVKVDLEAMATARRVILGALAPAGRG